MRHLLVALALACGPLGPAVCEVACAHERPAQMTAMPAMPDCHMAARGPSSGDAGIAVTSTGDCRHPESRPALRTAGASTSDAPAPAPVIGAGPAVPASGHGVMIAARVAHSPPARSAPPSLRI